MASGPRECSGAVDVEMCTRDGAVDPSMSEDDCNVHTSCSQTMESLPHAPSVSFPTRQVSVLLTCIMRDTMALVAGLRKSPWQWPICSHWLIWTSHWVSVHTSAPCEHLLRQRPRQRECHCNTASRTRSSHKDRTRSDLNQSWVDVASTDR